MFQNTGEGKGAAMMDVGGGNSTLVYDLHERELVVISLLPISPSPLAVAYRNGRNPTT